jgi:hypothetical protein
MRVLIHPVVALSGMLVSGVVLLLPGSHEYGPMLGFDPLLEEECSVTCSLVYDCGEPTHHVAIPLIAPPNGMYNERRDGSHESCYIGACLWGFTYENEYYEAKHPSCFVGDGGGSLLAAVEDLGAAAREGDLPRLEAAARTLKGRIDAADGGNALQVMGCGGAIIAHVPITREQYKRISS